MRFIGKYIFLTLFLVSISVKAESNLDSLWNIWQDNSKADTTRLEAIYNFTFEGYLYDSPDSAFYFGQTQYNFAKSVNNEKWMAKALYLQAISFDNRNDVENTLLYLNKLLLIYEKLGNYIEIGPIYTKIGIVYRGLGNYEKAIDYFHKNLEIVKKLNDETAVANACFNISIIYIDQLNLKKALEYSEKALMIYKKIKDKSSMASSYNCMGIIYSHLGESENSLVNYRKSLRIMSEIIDEDGTAMVYNNIGEVYKDLGSFEIALDFYIKALKISTEKNDFSSMAMYMSNIGITYNNMGQLNNAIHYLTESIKIQKSQNSIVNLDETTYELYNVYKKLGQKPEALDMYEYYISVKDSLSKMDGIEKTRQRDFQEKFLLEKQADSIRFSNEILLNNAKSDAKAKTDKVIRFSLIGGILLVFLSLVIVFSQLKNANKQKLVIESSKKHITDNINYAKKIQNTLLPDKSTINKFFNEHFIFFHPKDIVGGDFYWFRCFDDLAVVACVDCTGHGVAGGFMSMLGSMLLDKIVQNDKMKPSQILEQLNSEIIRVLKQGSGGKIQDGMDLSICIVDKKKRQLHYSGARNGICIIEDNNVKSFKGDMLPAGGSFSKKSREMNRDFTSQSIDLNENSWLIMYTDGYCDQLGGNKMRSMGNKKFKEILNLSVLENDKEKYLLKAFNDFKLQIPQVDDLLVMGFKI
tara:strand:- start:1141 stop:3225 length:2085 start_codon:yes stop_codon:yes gene_type:complete